MIPNHARYHLRYIPINERNHSRPTSLLPILYWFYRLASPKSESTHLPKPCPFLKKHSHIRPFILIFDCGRCCSNASCLTSQGNHLKASSPPSTYFTLAPCECVEQLSCSSTHLFFAVKALHGSPGGARTYNNSINSRLLCH